MHLGAPSLRARVQGAFARERAHIWFNLYVPRNFHPEKEFCDLGQRESKKKIRKIYQTDFFVSLIDLDELFGASDPILSPPPFKYGKNLSGGCKK